jgi:cytosine/adenosine deaminase-related metal-dependent hydrolase
MALLLKNATYVDWQTLEFKTGDMIIEEGEPAAQEPKSAARPPKSASQDLIKTNQILDCTGKLVMKSFACGHHHVYSALARGMGAPKKNPENFYEILKYIWWTLDKCLDLEMIEASALATALYCAKNGVTFVIDHHASPFAVENSLETIAKAFDKVGVSHLLCYEMSDRDGESSRQKGLQETENYLKSGRQGLVGLHASFTVGDELLKQAVNLAEAYNSGIHIHAAEDQVDQDWCLRDHKQRVIYRLFNAGALNFDKTILGHCLHLDDNERNILKDSQCFIAQNTDSNLNNNVGTFDATGLSDNIMLGTDGMYSDMLRSAKSTFFIAQANEGIGFDSIYHRFRKVHNYIVKNKFTGDSANNLVILNYDSPTPINSDNFLGHFVFGIDSSHVESVISNGRLIVQNKKVLTVNESEILSFSNSMAKKLWAKMKTI